LASKAFVTTTAIIPSRDQVQADTKGSYEFVVEHMGKAWAYEMRELI
jgi:hypothetical protein